MDTSSPPIPSNAPPLAPPTPAPSQLAAYREEAGRLPWLDFEDAASVLLGDGRVLVVGYVADYDDEDTEAPPVIARYAELWDPATAQWRPTEYPDEAGFRPIAVGLRDGRALLVAGATSASAANAVVFDPTTERWTKVGPMATARDGPATAVLADGRVLLAGGGHYTGKGGKDEVWTPLATAELFDSRTGRWSATGPMHNARDNASGVTLADGRVLVLSDRADPNLDNAFIDSEIYDPATGRFGPPEALPAVVDQPRLQALGVPASNRCDRADIGWPGHLIALDDGDALLLDSWWSCGRRRPGTDNGPQVDIIRSFRLSTAT